MILKNGKRLDGMGDSMPIGSIVEYNGIGIPDGWEILPGDANIYIGAEEPVDGQEVWIQQGRNLFNKNNFNRLEAYIEGGDTLITAHEHNKTLFIPCEPNTTYTIQKYKSNVFTVGYTTALPMAGVQAYGGVFGTRADYDGQIVSKTFTTGVNAKYLLVRYYNASSDTAITEQEMLDSIQIELGNVTNDYEIYIDKKIYVKNSVGEYEEFVNKKNLGAVVVDEIYTKNFFNKTGPLKKFVGIYGLALSNFIDKTLLGKQVTLSINQKAENIQIASQENKDIVMLAYNSDKLTFIVTQELLDIADEKYLWFIINGSFVSNGEAQLAYDIQCELGDKRTKYVPNSPIFIIESGSNNNGSWVKYSDGRMEISKRVSGTADITTAWGAIYTSDNISLGDYPVSFVERPIVNISSLTATDSQYILTAINLSTNTDDNINIGTICILRPNSRAGTPYIFDITATGRWK